MAGERLSYSEAVALLLVHSGVDSVKGLARLLGVSEEEAWSIVRGLEARGLVRVERRFLGGARVRLTRRGLDALPEAARLVEEVRGALLRAAEARRAPDAPEPALDPGLLALAPALAFLGLLPAWVLAVLAAGAPLAGEGAYEYPEAGEEADVDVGEPGFDVDF